MEFIKNKIKDFLYGSTTMQSSAPVAEYKELIFVGDSRTYEMEEAIHSDKTKYIAKKGARLKWLKNEAIDDLKDAISDCEYRAIIFNLGVNDIRPENDIDDVIEDYVKYFTDLHSCLLSHNCDVYYMSVNPFDPKKMQASGRGTKDYDEMLKFNAAIKSRLGKRYTYIDLCNHLLKYGWVAPDGIHYDVATYTEIYNRCIIKVRQTAALNIEFEWRIDYGEKYWYLYDGQGRKLKDVWLKYRGEWYCTDRNARRITNSLERHTNGCWYYLDKNGTFVKDDFVEIDGNIYYFRESGKMTRVKNDFREYNGKTYYFGTNCQVMIGFQYINGTWYYFRSDKYYMRQDCFADLGKNTYHFRADGELSSGWEEIGGDKYFFAKSSPTAHGGMMRRSKWINNSNGYQYYVGADGKLRTNQWIGDRWVDEKGRWTKSR